MYPSQTDSESPKFLTHSSLLIAGESPLSHPLSYSVKNWTNHPTGNRASYSPCDSGRNPENNLPGNPASHCAGYLPGNPASNGEGRLDTCSAGCSANCPDNHPERNRDSNLQSNGSGNLPDNSESDSADSGPRAPPGPLPRSLAGPLNDRGGFADSRLLPVLRACK